jgi:hypothetical protein
MLGTVPQAHAREHYTGSGFHVDLVAGVQRVDWGELPDHLSANGYEELNHTTPIFGVAFGVVASRIRGEFGFDFSHQTIARTSDGNEVDIEHNALHFELAYHVLERKHWSAFPMLGVGLVNQLVLPMPDTRPITNWNRDLTQQWGVMNFGIGAEYVLLTTVPKLTLGLRAGYVLGLGHGRWTESGSAGSSLGPSYLDGPVADPDGPFLKLLVGLAGP